MEIIFSEKKEDFLKDKSLKKILKLITKYNQLNNKKQKIEKYEELVRYIVALMRERRTDSLLQTTALWSLLNLLYLNKEEGVEIMLKCGVSTVLYEVLKLQNLPQHTKTYASQLISALWFVIAILLHYLSYIHSLSLCINYFYFYSYSFNNNKYLSFFVVRQVMRKMKVFHYKEVF